MSYDPDTRVSEILKSKHARIRQAPLDPGSPSWEPVQELSWGDIEARAKQGQPGYRTIRKLLTNSRFDK